MTSEHKFIPGNRQNCSTVFIMFMPWLTQLFLLQNLIKKTSSSGRKAANSTFVTSSPYKLNLEISVKRKQEAETLKNKNMSKKLDEMKSKEKIKKKSRAREETKQVKSN